MKKKALLIMKNLLGVFMAVSLFGCRSQITVGKDISSDDITDFYYTYENINYNAEYQRYRFYEEDGKHMFFHETRQRKNDYGPASEEDRTAYGKRELSAEEWDAFFDLLKGGTVKEREEDLNAGDSGPWTYLYRRNDKSGIQQFAFENAGKKSEFIRFCVQLAGTTVNEADDTGIVKSVDLDGKTIEYFRFGNRNGQTLVILPGVSLKSVMNSAQAVVGAYGTLAEDYNIYLFDYVKEMPEGYSAEDMADDLLNALYEIREYPVIIMGVSLGGMAAMNAAVSSPALVKALVLCSAASSIQDRDLTVIETWKRLAEERNTEELMKSFGENVYTPEFYEKYRDSILASGEGADEQDYQRFITSLDAVMNFDMSYRIGDIECPVFVLGAAEDRVLGSQAAEELMEQLHCEGYIYEGKGHGVYDEAPDYQIRIRKFLKEVK